VWVVAEKYSEAVRDQRATAIATRIQSRDNPSGRYPSTKWRHLFQLSEQRQLRRIPMQMATTIRSSQAVHETIGREYNASAGRYGVVLAELAWHRDLVAAGDRTNLRRVNWASAMGCAEATRVRNLGRPRNPCSTTCIVFVGCSRRMAQAISRMPIGSGPEPRVTSGGTPQAPRCWCTRRPPTTFPIQASPAFRQESSARRG
jgi:hypothetical protein